MIYLIEYENIFENKKKETIIPYKKGIRLSDCCEFDTEDFIYLINGRLEKMDIEVKDKTRILKKHSIKGKSLNKVLSVLLAVTLNTIFPTGMIGFGFSRALNVFAITMVGGKIINAIAPPPKPDFATGGSSGFEGSQAYGWSAPDNLIGQGYPKALTYGTVRTGGVVLGQKVTSGGNGQVLNMLLSGGEGEASIIDNILINGESITGFQGLTVEKRYGTNNQAVISDVETTSKETYFTKLIFAYLGGHPSSLVPANHTTITFTAIDAKNIDLNITFPSGLYQHNIYGTAPINQFFYFDFTGSVKNNSTGVVTVFSQSPLKVANLKIIDNKIFRNLAYFPADYSLCFIPGSSTPGMCSIKIWANEIIENYTDYGIYSFQGDITVRIGCFAKNGTYFETNYGGNSFIESVSQSIGASNGGNEFIYQNQIVLGLKAIATDKLNGRRPSITWEQTRKEIWAYNPDTTSYESKSSDNPAWIIYDLLHRCRKLYNINTSAYEYIVKGVEVARIDYDVFDELADYCDELVKNPDGTFRKRFVCNIIFDAWLKLTDAVEKVSSVCRANLIMKGTVFSIIWNAPKTAVQVFGMKDIIKDSYKEQLLDKIDRANAVELTFFNREKKFERDTIIEYGSDWTDEGYTENKTQSTYFGITNFYQAYEEAKYLMRLNKYQNRVCSFRSDIDGAVCQVGDVIEVSHELTEIGYSGGVVSGTANTIKLDKEITIETGKSYSVYVRHDDLSGEEHLIINAGTGSYDEFEITDTFTTTPAYFDSYVFGETGLSKKKFIVIEKNREADLYFDINCIEYDERIYTPDSKVIKKVISTADNRVKALRAEEIIEFRGFNNFEIFVNVTWIPNKETYFGARVMTFTANDDSNNAVNAYLLSEDKTSIKFKAEKGQSFAILVYSKDIFGRESQPQRVDYSVNGNLPVPSQVTGFSSKEKNDQLYLYWDKGQYLGLSHWEIRYSPLTDTNDLTWDNAEVFIKECKTNDYIGSGKTGLYMIKSVNLTGQYSDDYSTVAFASSLKLFSLDTDITKTDSDTWGELFVTTSTAPAMYFKEDTGSGLGSELTFLLTASTTYTVEELCTAVVDGFESVGTAGYYCNYDYQKREFTIGNDDLTELQLLFYKFGSPENDSAMAMADLLRLDYNGVWALDLTGATNYSSYAIVGFYGSGWAFYSKLYSGGSLGTQKTVNIGNSNRTLTEFINALIAELESEIGSGFEIAFNRERLLINNDNLIYYQIYKYTGVIYADLMPSLGFDNTFVYSGSNEYRSENKITRRANFQTAMIVGKHDGTANHIDTNNYLIISDIIDGSNPTTSAHSKYNSTTGFIEAYFELGEQFVLFHEQNVIINAKLTIDKNLPVVGVGSNLNIDDYTINWDNMAQIWDSDYTQYSRFGSIVQISEYKNSAWGDWKNCTSGGFSGSKFKFRIKLWTDSSLYTPAVLNPDIEIYAPYRTESKTLIEEDTGSGIHTITFEDAFETIPVVRIDFPEGEELTNGYQINFINRETFEIVFWDDYARTILYEGVVKFTYTAIGY